MFFATAAKLHRAGETDFVVKHGDVLFRRQLDGLQCCHFPASKFLSRRSRLQSDCHSASACFQRAAHLILLGWVAGRSPARHGVCFGAAGVFPPNSFSELPRYIL